MKHIVLPEDTVRPLTFYLAMEEVVARHFDEECFFTWVVGPTVIFGRHQVMEAEVNVAYCRSHGIEMVRRKSGGGCVYADEGNIMISYVTPCHNEAVQTTFTHYLGLIVEALRGAGLESEATGRNDILIGGRKVSGNSFWHTRTHSIVHGTLLHSVDMERMSSAITPSEAKLRAKGVESVRGRVLNISEVSDISLGDLRRRVVETLRDSETAVTDEMTREAEEVMATYALLPDPAVNSDAL